MSGMFVDEDQFPAALHDDISMESLPQNPMLRNRRNLGILGGVFSGFFFLLPGL
jgi:hypothetical protein